MSDGAALKAPPHPPPPPRTLSTAAPAAAQAQTAGGQERLTFWSLNTRTQQASSFPKKPHWNPPLRTFPISLEGREPGGRGASHSL